VVSVATAQKVRDAGHARTPRAQAPGSSNASVRLGRARFTSARGEGTKQGTPMSRDENQFSTPVRNSRVVVIGTRTLELLDRCCWSLSYYVRRLCFCKLGNLPVVCNFVGDGRQWSRNLRAHDTTREKVRWRELPPQSTTTQSQRRAHHDNVDNLAARLGTQRQKEHITFWVIEIIGPHANGSVLANR